MMPSQNPSARSGLPFGTAAHDLSGSSRSISQRRRFGGGWPPDQFVIRDSGIGFSPAGHAPPMTKGWSEGAGIVARKGSGRQHHGRSR